MRQLVSRLGRALLVGSLLLIPAAPVAASTPAPAYGVTLSVDSACTFTTKATFSHVKLSEVDVTFYMSAVERDPVAIVSPVHGHAAVTTRSLAVDNSVTRDFYVVATFYANGTLVSTQTSGTLTVGCGFLL